MNAFLKNYTSDVPVHITIGRIEQTLIRCGVTGITKEYGKDAKVLAIIFHIDLAGNGQRAAIRLPANESQAQEVLWLDYMGEDLLPDGKVKWGSRKRRNKTSFSEQAARTAWKLIQDWVEVQCSMIVLKQADFQQVFLPYVWDGRQTFYDRIKEGGYLALLPEKT